LIVSSIKVLKKQKIRVSKLSRILLSKMDNNDIIIDMTNAPPPPPKQQPKLQAPNITSTPINNTYSITNYGLIEVDISLYDNDYNGNGNNNGNGNTSNTRINILQSVCNFLKKYLPNSITNNEGQYV
jgi:hypothetical protein